MTFPPAPPKISACIITLDEAANIDACLDSLAPLCEDVLVVDSGSADDTCERARAKGARVLHRDFAGYRAQKQFAVQQARNDWVLCLDADERLTPALRTAIRTAQAQGFHGAAGYRFARATWYFGAFLRHGNAYPDRVLRLFDRRRGGFRGEREIHEHVEVDGLMQTLAGDLEHYAYDSLADQLGRLDRYSTMMAEHLHQRGKRARLARILINPFWRFLRGYALRAGFLDGWRGLVYALIEANYVRQKFIKHWLLARGEKV